ncbi:hypothetical protein Thimo_1287 [Thioflavicoccus mobilis 8321]|uniref:ATP-binding protein n=1 Tax=Thioflavicoccus mobilis 8321 TaxID=765912 RepID=L0GXR1_9GAMM|nr:SbcC/MukB-like Walker B domain-containing protein [Thioflavicoccus mobilis]AGA90084.1 hypothetical protein Thimo_1287 [Thioflavicoccus mobilis 8321]
MSQLPLDLTARAQQFRLRRLQVFNWGTFSGLHDIPIAIDGFLFVGRSGSGKSTLLDAFTALLVPPLWRDFNAAARDGDRGRADRNLVTYLRGAWADQSSADSGEILTRMLRPTTTWSALAAEYGNDLGQVVSLVQLFWIKGTSNRTNDARRHFLIAERPFAIGRELKGFAEDLDLRRLKQALSDCAHFERFEPYGERFRRLLGIESKMALKLLHKTQSAKNLGDLNVFLREFMLDQPETFQVAERLVEEFTELDAAHQAVVTARRQIEILSPARDAHREHQAAAQGVIELDQLLSNVDGYRDLRRRELLEAQSVRLATEAQGLAGRETQQGELVSAQKGALRSLEERHRAQGGARIEALEDEVHALGERRDQRLGRRSEAERLCRSLGWALPTGPEAFAELSARARSVVEGWPVEQERSEARRDALRDRRRDLAEEQGTVGAEVAAMLRQPSNIPAEQLALRARIAEALGLTEPDLPFVGELIEVRPEAAEWRGAIERVLHGFALSLLVEERRYGAVARYVNETHLGQRLVYFRVGEAETTTRARAGPQSLVLKLALKETSLRPWLRAELHRRFDYACVEGVRAFQDHERALTREGQVKQGRARHEKDDRHRIDDRRRWVLGFDNRDKLALFQQRAEELRRELAGIDRELQQLSDQRTQAQQRALACQRLANLQWSDIDVASLLDRIQALGVELERLRRGDTVLRALGEEVAAARTRLDEAEERLRQIQVAHGKVQDRLNDHQQELAALDARLGDLVLSETQHTGLAERFARDPAPLTLGNLDERSRKVERALNEDRRALVDRQAAAARTVQRGFAAFKREWPMEASELDDTLASAPEFLKLLQRIERDGLPRFEERFFTLLKDQSSQSLAELNSRINEARKEIRDRMELVNESLAEAEFNPGTHLQIEVSERQLPDVRAFREQVRQVLEHAWTLEHDPAAAEARFATLRALVTRLAGRESEHQRWREEVLDVRRHVEFVGREQDGEGHEIEVYRSGAGKSGGQREKLATTCLAAALRYQLGGSDGGLPIYAPVILDEAFGKADNEFTELAMRIFERFGFQMIVATPLKSVMTLEPFIGGACFVDITARNRSATLQIAYDHAHHRLDLPDRDGLLSGADQPTHDGRRATA